MTEDPQAAVGQDDVRSAVLDNWYRQLEAMDAADTSELRACFLPDAYLVHMTGRRQSLDEWMAGIERREFVYHASASAASRRSGWRAPAPGSAGGSPQARPTTAPARRGS